MIGNFDEKARKILSNAKLEMSELNHPYIGSEHLLLSILKSNNSVSKKLKELNLTYEIFKKEIIEIIGIGTKKSEWFLYTPLLKRVIENAIIDSKENNNGVVTIEHLFSSLLEEGDGVAIRIILGLNIEIDSLYDEFNNRILNKKKKNKKLLIEELGINLNEKALNNELDPVIGRVEEINRIIEILSRRTKNNPILVGEAGVGKTALVEELARLIVSGDVPLNLRGKRIISLDMATTVAGTKYRGEFEERVKRILNEIEENDDIILFIDEIHTLVGAGGAEGAIDASNIFKPALARGKLRCIGATTLNEYKEYIIKDGALDRRFQKVFVEEPTKENVKEILMKLKVIYEKYHLVEIKEEIIDLIINLGNRYIYDRNEPDKSIDILDEVCAKASLKESPKLKEYKKLSKKLNEIINDKNKALSNNRYDEAYTYKSDEYELIDKINSLELDLCKKKIKEVTIKDVAEVIHVRTKIPVYELLNENKKVIEIIKKDIESKIIGQNKICNEIIKIIKKIKLGFKDDGKCYSMMFCGPSGVGKTELSKIFGHHLTNSIIKLDMSEFSESHSVSKIIGSPPGYVGYDDNKNILEQIKNNPYSVLILDEIEKADQAVINLLFQIFDEGKIKDSRGNIVRFDNVVIIMTSNIGYNQSSIGFNEKNNNINKLKEYFSIPFINRIDNILYFDKLEENDIRKIIKIKLKELKNKYNKKNIRININNKMIDEIFELSEYDIFGARKIEKIIKDNYENTIIDNLLQIKT